MKIYYSKTTNGFYLLSLRSSYESSGTWPEDATELSDVEKSTYWNKQAPDGKQLGADGNGRPVWVDLPPPSDEEMISRAKIAGEVYADTGVTVPFTEQDQNGVVAVKAFFDGLKEAVSKELITQSEADAETTTIKFSNGQKLQLTNQTFLPFALWFGRKRNGFFTN